LIDWARPVQQLLNLPVPSRNLITVCATGTSRAAQDHSSSGKVIAQLRPPKRKENEDTLATELLQLATRSITYAIALSRGPLFPRDQDGLAFLMSTPWILGSRPSGSAGSSTAFGFSHSPLSRISASTLRVIWHPTKVLQAGFRTAARRTDVSLSLGLSHVS
jgi:hypothetical protein